MISMMMTMMMMMLILIISARPAASCRCFSSIAAQGCEAGLEDEAVPKAQKSWTANDGSFRKLGVPYFWGPYNKDPTI